MATATFGVPLKRIQGTTLSLTTSRNSLGIIPSCHEIMLYCPTAFRLHLNPKIKFLQLYDASAVAYVDLRANLSDFLSTTGSGTTLDAMQTNDILYLGCEDQVGGIYVAMTASLNGNASVIDCEYWNGSAWTDLTETDGTIAVAGKTLGQSGAITWTVPTDWARTTVNSSMPLYLVRVKVGSALSADVEIADIHTINKDTSRGYCEAGLVYQFSRNTEEVGALEALVAAGTDTLNITWIQH